MATCCQLQKSTTRTVVTCKAVLALPYGDGGNLRIPVITTRTSVNKKMKTSREIMMTISQRGNVLTNSIKGSDSKTTADVISNLSAIGSRNAPTAVFCP